MKDEFPQAKVTAIDCDLMDFSSVRKAAETIKHQFADGIDVLCNNAGIMADVDKATVDGSDPIEITEFALVHQRIFAHGERTPIKANPIVTILFLSKL